MAPDPANPAAAPESGARVMVGVGAVLLGTLGVPLDSAVNIDFPFITAHFHLAIPQIQWIVIAYTLATASLMLVFGRVADMLGYRRVFVAGCVALAIACLLCAAAPSYGALLFARGAQGVAAALVLSCGPALITALYPPTQRARALGLYTLGFGLGGVLGPALGGVLVARFGWSVVFWARTPIALAGAIAGFALPRPRRLARREQFDAPGALLLIVTIGALLLALDRLHAPGFALGAFALMAGALGGFVRHERRVRHPILDLAPFHEPGFALANLGNVLLNLAGFAVLLLVPFQLVRLAALTTTTAGVLLAAAPAGVMLAGPLAGWLAGRLTPARLMAAGAVLVAAGLGGIALRPALVASLAPAMALQGLGLGIFQVAYFDLITGAIPLRDRGVAGSLGMLTRTLGLVAGATLLMALFQGVRGRALHRQIDPAAAFAAGFRATFLLAALLAALVALLGVATAAARRRRAG